MKPLTRSQGGSFAAQMNSFPLQILKAPRPIQYFLPFCILFQMANAVYALLWGVR